MSNKMTVHRALAELKLIDSKIEKAYEAIVPTSYKQGTGLVAGVWTDDEFRKNAESRYDSVIALLDRKVKIKSAIVRSNARTQVEIGGRTMSVADAIAYKGVLLLKRTFIEQLRSKHRSAVASMNKNNDVVKANVQKLLEMTFGKDNVKAEGNDVESVRRPYMDANEVKLVNPLDVDAKVEQLEKEVADFAIDVDAVLSESNAVTFIEVD